MPQLYQTFKDKKEAKGYAEVFETYDKEKFTKLNSQGMGIYKTVNEFDATEEELKNLAIKKGKKRVTKRNGEFLKKLKYVFADIDYAKEGDGKTQKEIDDWKEIIKIELNIKCPPTIIINTKNGLQPLREIQEDKVDKETQNKYVNVINGIIEWSKQHGGAGDAVKDCARVLRVPGYYHMKSEPYMVTHESFSDKAYTLDELKDLFPYKKNESSNNNVVSNVTSTISTDNYSLQFQEVERLDIQDVVIKAFSSIGRTAEFDKQKRLILDGRLTGTHQGKTGDGQFIASNSHEPFVGNKVSVVADILSTTNKEAYKWILDSFNIKSESELKKKDIKKLQKKEGDLPMKFSEMKRKKFSMGSKYINEGVGHFWENEIVLLHGKSKNGKTFYTMSIANDNGKPVSEGGYGNKVAFYSLEMDKKKLKTQQASIRSGISRLQFELENYTEEQWKEYCKVYKGFDKYFTIFDDNDFGSEEGMTLDNLITQIEKQHVEDGYNMFIIDSLKLIGGQGGITNNSWEGVIIKELRKVKNKLPVCIVLIHHNSKGGNTFSGSQDLENFCDCRIEIKKSIDPDADGTTTFNQTKIRIYKERFGTEVEYTFDFKKGRLDFNSWKNIEQAEKEEKRLENKTFFDTINSNY